MPGNVSSFIRRNSGLNIYPGELGDQHVEHVGNRCFSCGSLHVLGVHLGSHPISVTEIPQGNRIGQIHKYAWSRRCRGRNRRQANIAGLNLCFFREEAVDRMLYDELRHYLPGFSRRGVGIVSTVDLGDVCPGQNLLGFAGVHKGTDHIDVPIQHIVLGILVSTVDALLGKHDGHFRTGNTRYIGMVVNRSAHFILDHIQRFPLCSDLFTRNRHTAHTLGRSFDKPIHMGLSCGTDDHDMICPVPCGHSHSTNVILKAPGGDFRGNNRLRLGVDIVKVLGRWQPYSVFHGGSSVPIGKGAHLHARFYGSPGPSPSLWSVFIQVFQDVFNVQFFVVN